MKKIIMGMVLIFSVNLYSSQYTDLMTGNGKTLKEGMVIANQHCDNGDGLLCLVLGIIYDTGDGVKKDGAKAQKYFEKSCEAKESQGCYNAGVGHYNGSRVKKNYVKSYQYLDKASKLGDKGAQENLSMLCKNNPWACK